MNSGKNTLPPKEHTVAFVVARLSSSRFAAKQLQTIGDKSILQWIIDSLRRCHELDEIVIATVNEEANQPLRNFAEKEGLPCFWYEGEVDHVTTRLRKAAEVYNADICLLISADCPLIYAPAIDHLITELRSKPKAENLIILPDDDGQPSALEGVQIARKQAWKRADDLADRPELKEHQFPLIWMRPELFTHHCCQLANDLYAPPHRFSVDTRADLDFMNQLHDRLTQQQKPFELPEVLRLMQREPDLAKINRHVHQRKLVEPDNKVLIILDSGPDFGFGHLMRSLELADQLTERLGWPVTFMIDDDKTATRLNQRGQHWCWGAFGREVTPSLRYKNTPLEEIAADYSLLILDIFDQRGPTPGWRRGLPETCAIVSMDNRQNWAAETDLIITPGVTANLDLAETFGQVRHISGTEAIILRREIQQMQQQKHEKNFDILAYLHDPDQRRALSTFAATHQLRIALPTTFTNEMPQLMAQAHSFISGFGISFYEALALGTTPICWPDSGVHRRDAEIFYSRLNMPSLIVSKATELKQQILPLLRTPPASLPTIKDGTPNLVKALATLVQKPAPRTGGK